MGRFMLVLSRDWTAGSCERLALFYIIAKSELLGRTKEWNDALEQYYDDAGLTGKVRRQNIEKHAANPLAPCANPSCNKYEEKVKSFPKCLRCKGVAYCSSLCQREQ